MRKLLKKIAFLFIIATCVAILFPAKVLEYEALLIPSPQIPLIPRPQAIAISIESIGVYALIEHVGITGAAMAAPENSLDVGWYKYGVRPGDEGSAVLAGHVSGRGGKDAVFTNLHLIHVGDTITISYDDGSEESFTVKDMKQYPVISDTTEVFVSHDGKAHLNLITCAGVWSTAMGTHNLRLVVFADKI